MRGLRTACGPRPRRLLQGAVRGGAAAGGRARGAGARRPRPGAHGAPRGHPAGAVPGGPEPAPGAGLGGLRPRVRGPAAGPARAQPQRAVHRPGLRRPGRGRPGAGHARQARHAGQPVNAAVHEPDAPRGPAGPPPEAHGAHPARPLPQGRRPEPRGRAGLVAARVHQGHERRPVQQKGVPLRDPVQLRQGGEAHQLHPVQLHQAHRRRPATGRPDPRVPFQNLRRDPAVSAAGAAARGWGGQGRHHGPEKGRALPARLPTALRGVAPAQGDGRLCEH
mmetsp:Transcript_6812/g.12020  ORF Transcript_6812/g.12020 Transcript_6812/m.12020 type:complete len:278 (+) Transcript_6812:541-1374(+)